MPESWLRGNLINMSIKILFVLLLLPGLAQAVICKTVGADGVISFTDVPAAECPPGAAIPDPVQRSAPAERADRVETGIGGREVFPGYRSIAIETPQDEGTVRSNEGRVPVEIALEPGLQADHFLTAYLDGKAFRGRYGNDAIELTGVDRGTHELWVTVTDSKGKTLIESKKISFTLQRTQPVNVRQVAPNPDPGKQGKYIISGQFLGGPVALPAAGGAEVTIRFPGSEKEYKGKVDEFLNWEVEVGSEPAVETQFDVNVKVLNLEFTKTQDINPTISQPVYMPPPSNSYTPPGTPDYRSKSGGISTTPGQTNPAFQPKYTP